jgi:hypothetical protein
MEISWHFAKNFFNFQIHLWHLFLLNGIGIGPRQMGWEEFVNEFLQRGQLSLVDEVKFPDEKHEMLELCKI